MLDKKEQIQLCTTQQVTSTHLWVFIAHLYKPFPVHPVRFTQVVPLDVSQILQVFLVSIKNRKKN